MKYFLLLATLLTLTIGSQKPGATISLDMRVLAEAKHTLADLVLNSMKKVPIEDITFEEGHLKNNTFSIVETYS